MSHVEAAVISHPGILRENNEDNFFLNGIYKQAETGNDSSLFKSDCHDKRQLYAVCDGIGGMNNGEVAAQLVASHLAVFLSAGIRDFPRYMQEYIDKMSNTLQSPDNGCSPAGCTLAIVYLDGSRIRVAHLGDSRVYFKRGNLVLTQVTEDHSQAAWFATQGILTPEQAEIHPSRNVLRRYIGAPNQCERTTDISGAMRLRRGDVFLICSDGLSNMVDVLEMDAEVLQWQNSADVCRSLVTLALTRGGKDNITVLMTRII